MLLLLVVGKFDLNELVALKSSFNTLQELRRQARFANVQNGLHPLSRSLMLPNFRIGQFFHLFSDGNLSPSSQFGKKHYLKLGRKLYAAFMQADAPHTRFREARERIGLTPDEVATKSRVSDAGVWDIEAFEGDLTCAYSPADVQKFCRVLCIEPAALFGGPISEPPVSADELVRLIHEECRARGVSLEQFEDAVGWRLSESMEPPARLREDLTVDALQWLCRELRIDWRRAL